MSNVYATEPATSGRVVFETTHGPLEVQLWCRECPLTTKLFLQLCQDGFYDSMIFHRIVPNFLIQTGALRQSTVASSEKTMEAYRTAVNADEALERRQYEVHSRLRFNHRGQVAMALGVSDENDVSDLQPQFFITLDEAPYLDGKHVLFGTVNGPTIFNAIRIGSNTEVDEATNQPVDMEHAPRILSVKIVDNPIHTDLTPQTSVPWREVAVEKSQKKKKKRKGKLDVNVLSFGDELDDGETAAATSGIKSSHDVLDSKALSKQVDQETAERAREKPSKRDKKASSEGKRKRRRVRDPDVDEPLENDVKPVQESEKASIDREKSATTTAKPTSEQANVTKKHVGPQSRSRETERSQVDSIIEARRSKYVKGRASKKQREEDTMAKLMAFQSKVKTKATSDKSEPGKDADNSLASRMARRAQKAEAANGSEKGMPTYHGQILESDDDEQEGKQNWLNTTFKCRKHMDHEARESSNIIGGDGRAADDYLVVDEKYKRSDREHSGRHHHKRHKHHHQHSHEKRKEGHHRHHKH